jgi:GT2 family glycosyltransferase
MKKVAILLVLYNDAEHVPKLVESLRRQTYKNIDVYAIENSVSGASIDLLKRLYPDAKTFPHLGNFGFAAGNNYLAKKAFIDGADFLFVLNTDMELSSNTIEVFINQLNIDDTIGVIGSLLMIGNSDTIQLFGAKANFKTQKKELLFTNKKLNEIILPDRMYVDFLNGGSLFIIRDVYQKVGLFNEDFFMYNDEIEFAFKVKKTGYRFAVTSETLIRHYHNWNHSNSKSFALISYYRMRNRQLYFIRKKLYGYLIIDLLKELLFLIPHFYIALRNNTLLEFRYYYCGQFDGLIGKKGISNLQFD